MKNDRYYYKIMSPLEKQAYKMIYSGLEQRAFNIVVELPLSPDQVQEAYLKVLYDNPHFYYINQTVIRMMGEIGYYILMPEYLYTSNEINAINREIRRVVNKVADKANQFASNQFRLEKFLHDSVVKSVAYDYESLKKTDCFNAHSIVGAFLENKAVCEGIAKAFKLLCNEFDMKCIVVLGKANREGDFTRDDYHAWNLVKIGDESYHVDVTWDNMYDREPRFISYDYFNLTTKQILRDHQPIGELPECISTTLNYYNCTNSFVSTYTELVDFIGERLGEKKIMFRANMDRGEFRRPEELKEKTFTAMLHNMHMRGAERQFAVSFNEMHNVVNIIMGDPPPKKIDLRKYER